tara:strand:+ start:4402 stop:5325 length:924 start_codon:yes stop_codon:yes gene_type:complete
MIPKISFIIATYNNELFLKKCIDSCLNQTYENIEVCITDDGSNDSTSNILELYDDDTRIKFSSFKQNKGICSALNNSYKMTSGKYIAIIDADDINYDDRIERQYKHLKKTNSDFVYSNFDYFYDNSKTLIKNKKLKEPNKVSILFDNLISGGSMLFSRKMSSKVFPIPDDLEFSDWWIAFQAVYFFNFSLIDFPSFKYRIHKNNTSGNNDNFFQNKRKNLARHVRYHDYINKVLLSNHKLKKYVIISKFNLLYKKSILSDSFKERLIIFINSFKYVTPSNIKKYPIFILITLFGFRTLAFIKNLVRY